MELTEKQIRSLAQAMDSTWGRASTGYPVATRSVKASLHGDRLIVKYLAAVTIGHVSEMHRASAINKDEAVQTVKQYIVELKKKYKEIAGETIQIKEVKDSADDSFELVGNPTSYDGIRRGYYRFHALFDLGKK